MGNIKRVDKDSDGEFYITFFPHSHTLTSKRLWRSRFSEDVLTAPPARMLNLGDFLFRSVSEPPGRTHSVGY